MAVANDLMTEEILRTNLEVTEDPSIELLCTCAIRELRLRFPLSSRLLNVETILGIISDGAKLAFLDVVEAIRRESAVPEIVALINTCYGKDKTHQKEMFDLCEILVRMVSLEA